MNTKTLYQFLNQIGIIHNISSGDFLGQLSMGLFTDDEHADLICYIILRDASQNHKKDESKLDCSTESLNNIQTLYEELKVRVAKHLSFIKSYSIIKPLQPRLFNLIKSIPHQQLSKWIQELNIAKKVGIFLEAEHDFRLVQDYLYNQTLDIQNDINFAKNIYKYNTECTNKDKIDTICNLLIQELHPSSSSFKEHLLYKSICQIETCLQEPLLLNNTKVVFNFLYELFTKVENKVPNTAAKLLASLGYLVPEYLPEATVKLLHETLDLKTPNIEEILYYVLLYTTNLTRFDKTQLSFEFYDDHGYLNKMTQNATDFKKLLDNALQQPFIKRSLTFNAISIPISNIIFDKQLASLNPQSLSILCLTKSAFLKSFAHKFYRVDIRLPKVMLNMVLNSCVWGTNIMLNRSNQISTPVSVHVENSDVGFLYNLDCLKQVYLSYCDVSYSHLAKPVFFRRQTTQEVCEEGFRNCNAQFQMHRNQVTNQKLRNHLTSLSKLHSIECTWYIDFALMNKIIEQSIQSQTVPQEATINDVVLILSHKVVYEHFIQWYERVILVVELSNLDTLNQDFILLSEKLDAIDKLPLSNNEQEKKWSGLLNSLFNKLSLMLQDRYNQLLLKDTLSEEEEYDDAFLLSLK